jgi:mannose-6-phosphate isomerase-like protein (cupin superfamily)
MSMSHVIRSTPQRAREVLTRERCYIREILNDPQVPQWSLAECRVVAGVTTELHRLTVDEWYVIVEGAGLMEVDRQKPVAIGLGDTVAIPRGIAQRITNSGQSDLRFQCVCMPRFTPDCYEALEEDLPANSLPRA